MEKGLLYIVATPIGNLADMTGRAVETLRTVGLIACEDTRKTGVLLKRHAISTPLISVHKFSEAKRVRELLDRVAKGEDVALVSDAGTPAVSDPGTILVREAHLAGIRVVPIPGPSSIVAAVSASGMDGSAFSYLGYAPRKDDQRRAFFRQILEENRTVVFFETALRIKATMRIAEEILGPTATVALMRELTKTHEEILRGDSKTVLEALDAKEAVKGEITVVIEATSQPPTTMDPEEAVRLLMSEGLSGKRLAEEARQRFRISKKDAYDTFLELKKED